jgi:aspartate kinase
VTDGEIPAPFRTDTTEEEDTVEQPIITGVAHDRSEAKLTIVGVPDVPGKAAAIFSLIAEQEINIDMIVQNISTRDPGRTDISFTLPMTDGAKAIESLETRKDEIGFDHIRYDDQIGKLSVVGDGMRSNPGVTATLFRALSAEGVNIDLISTSEIRISVVTRAEDLDRAVQAAHRAYGLDSEDTEAVVYGGTGR